MKNDHLIPVALVCTQYKIDPAFITSLSEYGLVEISTVQQEEYISFEYLSDLERIMRLHFDLEINIEGIEAIAHLIQKVNQLQTELTVLKNRLSLYEESDH